MRKDAGIIGIAAMIGRHAGRPVGATQIESDGAVPGHHRGADAARGPAIGLKLGRGGKRSQQEKNQQRGSHARRERKSASVITSAWRAKVFSVSTRCTSGSGSAQQSPITSMR